MLRTLLRAAVVVAMVASVIVPITPAMAAPSYTFTLITDPVTVTRNKVDYNMTIIATQTGDGDSMTIALSRKSDPTGVTEATQTHQYSWYFVGNRFIPKTDLTVADLATSAEMKDYGNVKLHFDDNGGRQSLCDTTTDKAAPGKIVASDSRVALKTGSKLFGTISNLPTTATLYRTSEGCSAGGHGYDPDACPPAGFSVMGYKSTASSFLYMAASENATGPANIMFHRSTNLPAAKTNAPGDLTRSVNASVPRGNVTIGTGLASATITGQAGTWIGGTATFTANAKAYAPYAYPCDDGAREAVYTTRPGAFTGDLNANVWVGPNITLGKSLPGSASKTQVRAV